MLGAVIYKALVGNSNSNFLPQNTTKHLLHLQPERRAHLQRRTLSNYQNKNQRKGHQPQKHSQKPI